MTEKEYRAAPGINYSLLSKLATSPVGLEEKEETKSYFTMGSLVDCLCTAPEEYYDKYYIATVAPPSDAMVAYCKTLLTTGDKDAAWTASGLKSDPTVVAKSSKDGLSKYDKEGKAYLLDLKAGAGKEVISFEDNATANKLANELATNKFTSKYFTNGHNMYQKAIIWDYYGRECKSLLDIIHIDHGSKTIRPVDLKTTGKSVLSFASAYLTYKYYLQAAFYTEALKWALVNDPEFDDINDYELLPFQFVVIETNYKNPPHIFEVSKEDLTVGEFGGKIEGRTYDIQGFQSLIDDLMEHKDTGQWEYKHEVHNNNGVIELNSLVYNHVEELA